MADNEIDAVVVGAGPNGLVAAAAPGPGRTFGPRRRGARHDRRRDPFVGADPARVRARRVLGDPSPRRQLPRLRRAVAGRPRPALALPGGRPRPSTRRWPRRRRRARRRPHRRGPRSRRQEPGPATSVRTRRVGGSCPRCSSARSSASPAIPWRSPSSASRRSRPPAGWSSAGSRPTRPRRSSPAVRRTPSCRSSTPTSASFGLVLLASAHAVGWPVAEGGSQRIADALAAVHHRSRRTRSRRAAASPPSPSCPPRGPCSSTWRLATLATIAGDRLPQRFSRRLRRYRYGAAAFKVDYALDGPVPWITNTAPTPAPCTWPATRRRSPRRRPPSGGARCPSGRSCSSPSSRSSTRAGRRRASTRCGPTATSRTAARST